MNNQRDNNTGDYHIPGTKKLHTAYSNMSRFERGLLYFFGLLLVITVFVMLAQINAYISTTVPVRGGSHTEGIVGFPRFINPVLASSDADRDLTQLVYAGLMKPRPDGTLEKDLAAEYSISDDGLTYTFHIKDDAVFHDGEPVTAEDVVFTVHKAQDGAIRSPKQGNWDGVSVEQVGEKTVQFVLPEPYSPFLENTTLGILPKHLWDTINVEQFPFSRLNTNPVGAGPYEVTDIGRDASGVPEYYVLEPFDDYTGGAPFLETITTRFYSNEEDLISAYESGDIDAVSGISSAHARELQEDGKRIITEPLPRIFGVFFNQNQAPIFTDRAVRRALNTAVDRDAIIADALNNYGTAVTGPLPPNVDGVSSETKDATSTEARLENARTILENAGWEQNESGVFENGDGTSLAFSISTSNAPELQSSARALERIWEEMGADIELEFFETGSLNQEVIRTREYDALLFGQIIGRDKDLYAFWHSSQRNDPGLNIAMYANITADDLLEEMRQTTALEERRSLYEDFAAEVNADVPAVFLYAPDFVYVLPEDLQGVDIGTVTTAAERFLDVHTWYTQTTSVWNIFIDEEMKNILEKNNR